MKKILIILLILFGILTLINKGVNVNDAIFNEKIIEKGIDNNMAYIDIPESYILDNVIAEDQHPQYLTGCESIALHILLNYYGIDVSIDDIIKDLPKGELPFEVNGVLYGSNPEKVFVGDPSNLSSYGVYNKPIAEVANKYKKGAVAKNNVSIEDIQRIIYYGNPVIAWTNITEKIADIVISKTWYDMDTFEKVNWISGEHAVVVYGYDQDNFYISNPYNGKKYPIKKEIFIYYYEALGKRIVYYK